MARLSRLARVARLARLARVSLLERVSLFERVAWFLMNYFKIIFFSLLLSPMHVLRREKQRIHVDQARRIKCARVIINLTREKTTDTLLMKINYINNTFNYVEKL